MLDIINAAYERFGGEVERGVILKLLREANDYAETHFRYEETFMKAVRYPDFSAHVEVHEHYRLQIRRFATSLLKDDQLSLEEFFEFLKTWWRGHILNVDARYAAYAEETFISRVPGH